MIRNWAWLNGNWLDAEMLAIPVWDAGFVFGATVTDLCRTINHRLFRWTEHVQRFARSAQLCKIPLPYSGAELTAIAQELVARQTTLLGPSEDLALILFATPGGLAQYRPFVAPPNPAQSSGETLSTVGMHTFRLPLARYARYWREGFRLVTVPVAPPLPESVPRAAKHRSRLHYWLAQRCAEEICPGATALLCDTDGCLLETAFANLVLVRGNDLYSPPAERILPGVSLQCVAELAQQLGWEMHYRPLFAPDVAAADEAFLTSSSFCLLPVSQLDEKRFPCPGPKTVRLMQAWSETLAFDLLEQLTRAEVAAVASP